jgi:hypothetical protein
VKAAPAALIAALQGGSTPEMQSLLDGFAASLPAPYRAVGVVEEIPPGGPPDGSTAQLRSLTDRRRYDIFQDLGPHSKSCGLLADNVLTACAAVCHDLAQGCDLVVLSKFGKLEAEGSGLLDAFGAAVAAQIPILTSVAPKFDAEWAAFASPYFVILPPDPAAIAAWWWTAAPAVPRAATASHAG